MSVEEIATVEPDGTPDAAGPVDGPNPAEVAIPAEGTANPSTEPEPIDPRDADWDRTATWHLKEIAALESKEHRTRQAFDREIERLQDERDMALAPIRNSIEWHRAPLIGLHRALLALDPKHNKTITLPYGKLTSSTPQKPTVRIMERDVFIEWARTNAPELVVPKYNPDLKGLNAALGDTLVAVGTPKAGWSVDIATAAGEIIPGVTLALADTTFSIHMDDEL